MPAEKDFIPGLDVTGLTSITQAQLMAITGQAYPYPNKGLVLYGDTTPDVANNLRFARYLWIDTSTTPYVLKQYNGTIWEPVTAGQITLASQINDGIITIAKLNPAGTALQLIRVNASQTAFEFVNFADFLANGVIPLPALNQGGAMTGYLLAWNGSAWAPTVPPSISTVAMSSVTGCPGVIFPFGGAVVPSGFLLCDGTSYTTAAPYDLLFAAIGYGWGGSGSLFKVPDLRGRGLLGAGIGVSTWTFETTDVNTGSDTITLNATNNPRGLGEIFTGTALVLSGGSLPAGLVAGTYYAIRTGALTLQLASSLALALAGTAIDITTVGAGSPVGTFTLTLTSRVLGQNYGEETHGLKVSEIPAHHHTVDIPKNDATDTVEATTIQGILASVTTYTSADTGGSGAHNIVAPAGVVNYIIKYT